MNNFYVYVYLDPRKIGNYIYDDLSFGYEPFYVGKGKRNRCYNGIKDKHKCLKTTRIKSILDDGKSPIIIKIFTEITEDESFSLEIETIRKIGRINKNNGPLTNMTDGGDGTSGRIDRESDILRKRKFKHTEEWKRVLCKPVIQIKDGTQINEYKSVKEAAEKTGLIKQNISACLTGKYKTTGGFSWRYKNENDRLQGHLNDHFKMPKHSDETKSKMSYSAKRGENHPAKKKMGKNSPFSKKVIQKSMEGKIIKIWDSLQDIKRELGFTPSNICRCCQGSVKRIGGFKWEYYNS